METERLVHALDSLDVRLFTLGGTASTLWDVGFIVVGLTVLFWSFAGQLRVQLSWAEDCLSPDEVNSLEQGLRSGLLEEEIS